jgi:YHS domain-containing protein
MNITLSNPIPRKARWFASLAALVLTALHFIPATQGAPATDQPVGIKQYNLDSEKVALKGYDPVGYINDKTAVKGKKEISTEYQGVTYHFATQDNRKLFAASPEKYLPAYGGWCATAMAKGEKVQIDPSSFKVTNGRLFLFYNGLFGNAIKDWNKDESALTAKADTQWKKISGQ